MFDTIVIKAKEIIINPDAFKNIPKGNLNYRVNIDTETGEKVTSYQVMRDEQIPFIKYYENSRTLKIQCSIPKFLYGENITLITEQDIEHFFNLLQEKLFLMFGVKIEHYEWITERIDVCWNFEVDNVSEYIRQLGRMTFPYKDTIVYNHNETVIFKNKSSQVKFYDKEKQCKDERAKGVLRMEIEPSDNAMRKYSPTRQTIELLTREFFIHQTEKAMSNVKFMDIAEVVSHDWLLSHDIRKAERYLGFVVIMEAVEETIVRELYKQSFRSRIKLLEEMMMPDGSNKLSLEIDYSQVG